MEPETREVGTNADADCERDPDNDDRPLENTPDAEAEADSLPLDRAPEAE